MHVPFVSRPSLFVFRLAAARYDWRVPEEDEADQEVEVTAPLRETLARAAAAKSKAVLEEDANRPPTSAGTSGGRPWLPSPSAPVTPMLGSPGNASQGGTVDSLQPALSSGAPASEAAGVALMPTEQLLVKMVETFLAEDFLPKARRSVLTGSLLSKERSQMEKTTPPGVWRL